MGFLSRRPEPRPPQPRDEVRKAHLWWSTTSGKRPDGAEHEIIFFNDIAHDPQRFADLRYSIEWIPLPNQTADEFNLLVDAALALISGEKTPNDYATLSEQTPGSFEPMHSAGVRFNTYQALAHEIHYSGLGKWRDVTWLPLPGQSLKRVNRLVEELRKMDAEFLKLNPLPDQRRQTDSGLSLVQTGPDWMIPPA